MLWCQPACFRTFTCSCPCCIYIFAVCFVICAQVCRAGPDSFLVVASTSAQQGAASQTEQVPSSSAQQPTCVLLRCTSTAQAQEVWELLQQAQKQQSAAAVTEAGQVSSQPAQSSLDPGHVARNWLVLQWALEWGSWPDVLTLFARLVPCSAQCRAGLLQLGSTLVHLWVAMTAN